MFRDNTIPQELNSFWLLLLYISFVLRWFMSSALPVDLLTHLALPFEVDQSQGPYRNFIRPIIDCQSLNDSIP